MKAAEDLVNSVPDAECVGTFSLFEVMGFNGSKKLNQKHVSAIKIESLQTKEEKKEVKQKIYQMRNMVPPVSEEIKLQKIVKYNKPPEQANRLKASPDITKRSQSFRRTTDQKFDRPMETIRKRTVPKVNFESADWRIKRQQTGSKMFNG